MNEPVNYTVKTVTKIAANPALSKKNDPNRVLKVTITLQAARAAIIGRPT